MIAVSGDLALLRATQAEVDELQAKWESLVGEMVAAYGTAGYELAKAATFAAAGAADAARHRLSVLEDRLEVKA